MLHTYNYVARDSYSDAGHADVTLVESNEIEALKCLYKHLTSINRDDLKDDFRLVSVRPYFTGVVLSTVEQGCEALQEILNEDHSCGQDSLSEAGIHN